MKFGISVLRDQPFQPEFELTLIVSNGESKITTRMYAVMDKIIQFQSGIKDFLFKSVPLEFQFGKFGPDFAGGAALLHFSRIGQIIYIEAKIQERHIEFGSDYVAAEAKIFLKTEIFLLEKFIDELGEFSESKSCEAFLQTY